MSFSSRTLKFFLSIGVLSYSAGVLAKEVIVTQKDKEFKVGSQKIEKPLEVHVGDTIVVRNDETDVSHNVYGKNEKEDTVFKFLIQKPGEKDEFKVEQAGTIEVKCAIHPGMKFTIKATK